MSFSFSVPAQSVPSFHVPERSPRRTVTENETRLPDAVRWPFQVPTSETLDAPADATATATAKIATIATTAPSRAIPTRDTRRILRLPVPAHQLMRPLRLADLLARRELGHVRLDVEHGGAVDRVQRAHGQLETLHRHQLARAHADPVRPALVALREHAQLGPVRIAARAPRLGLEVALCHT